MEKNNEELYLKLSHIPEKITSNFLEKKLIREQDFEDLQQELHLKLLDFISRGLINEKNKLQASSRIYGETKRSIYLRRNSLGWNGIVCGIGKGEKKISVEKEDVEETPLSTLINEDDDNLCEDYILDCLNLYFLRETTEKVLNTLTIREKYILVRRFGLDGDGGKTLYEVGRELEVTGEAIRAAEKKALRKLRHPTRSKPLRKFF